MSGILIKKFIKGKSKTLLSWSDFTDIFNSIYGEDRQTLPYFPKVMGATRASWKDAEDVTHNVDNINDIKEPYESKKTSEILTSGSGIIGENSQTIFWYWPSELGFMLSIEGDSGDKIEKAITKVKSYFPYPFEPIKIFISYDTSELKIAEIIKKLVEKRISPEVKIFIAKSDIRPGEHPTKRMLEEELLKAEGLIAICSKKSKSSPWLWWESASIWTRGKLLIPLFFKITAKDFDGPMILIAQGKDITKRNDLDIAIQTLVKYLDSEKKYRKITDSEWKQLEDILK